MGSPFLHLSTKNVMSLSTVSFQQYQAGNLNIHEHNPNASDLLLRHSDSSFNHMENISNPIITTIPNSRFKEIWNANDIASTIEFLASDNSSLIAAEQALQVDDGEI